MLDLNPILRAVQLAADLTRRVQALHLAGNMKDGGEPVTIADYGSQAILLRAIALAYPDDAVLAEETAAQFADLLSADQRAQIARLVSVALGEVVTEADLARLLEHGRGRKTERVWAIDPIDGTKGFIAGRRYSIAVGALEGGLPVAGVLAAPGYPTADGGGLLFHAQRGAAYMQKLSGGKVYRIAVASPPAAKGFANLRVVESAEDSHADHEGVGRVLAAAGITRPRIERVDGQDKYAMIACGDADLYLRLPREDRPRHKIWDHLAGTALVHAAGGVVTDLDGSPLDFSGGRYLNNRGIVASSGAFHDRILEALAALGKI